MTINIRNDELVNLLKPDLQGRHENTFHWESAVSAISYLPALRAFWPMSSVDYTTANRAMDIAGEAYHLTAAGESPIEFGYDDTNPPTLPAYAQFAGDGGLFRADGGAANWADIIGTETYIIPSELGITLGCWVYFDNAAAATEYVMSKWLVAGNQRSYALGRNAAGNAVFEVSTNGAAIVTVTSTDVIPADTWTFIVGRLVPSATLDVWVNDNITQQAAGVPATIFDSTADFYIATNDPASGNWLTGRVSLAWLCACHHADAHVWGLFQRTRAAFGV